LADLQHICDQKRFQVVDEGLFKVKCVDLPFEFGYAPITFHALALIERPLLRFVQREQEGKM
jgi:hypothetical protein